MSFSSCLLVNLSQIFSDWERKFAEDCDISQFYIVRRSVYKKLMI